MLRSEALWFPLFIRCCEAYLHYVMNPLERDYEPMQRVTQCQNFREVRTLLKEYNQPHVDFLVQKEEVDAKKAITRDYGIRFR